MSSPPENDEAALWRRLHACPQILERIAAFDGPALRLQTQLRQEFPDELVRKALTLVDLRKKAVAKFSRAEHMWFDRTGYEQATPELVAAHKAQRFSGTVWDFCCGIGGDAIALAARATVRAVDVNPSACLWTEWNAQAYGVHDSIETVRASIEDVPQRDGLLHIDPDRRPGPQGRTLRLEDAVPPLPVLRQLMSEFRGGAVKFSPAGNFMDKFPGSEIELISLRGECKEATIWFGELAGRHLFRATMLPSGETIAGHPLESIAQQRPPGRFLYDPDPAIVRAGLVDVLAESRGLARLDSEEEYLTSDELVTTSFARAFEVLDVTPNNPRDYRRAVAHAEFGQIEIKCRHVPVDAQKIRRKLPLNGIQPGVLVFARVEGKTRALVCRRVAQ